MRIEHVAMWTEDLERLATFYSAYFGAVVGKKYENRAKGFESRFLSFDSGTRLEIMRTTALSAVKHDSSAHRMGLTHLAFAIGSERGVDELTSRLRRDGHPILDGPRRTGDGYYESIVLDPDGNRVEVTA
ncbi:MAG TPA: VOC family protein [Steroidobacteraceae bacterium]|nr:VOC family protein [Steroidobacteraceae bacterium]